MLLVLGFGRHGSGRYIIPRFARLRLCSRLHFDRLARMPTLLRPQRSAHASIRGYLYQTALGVLRWLALEEGEALVFEGDEDLDRLMIADPTTEGISEQVKAYQGKLGFGDRVVRENVRNFLVAYVALRERGEKRRFVFTTTAAARREAELLKWRDPAAQGEVVGEVRQWVVGVASEKDRDSVNAALAWFGRGKKRWREFLDAVEWRFGAPELGEVRKKIRAAIERQGFDALGDFACDRLLWEAFLASSAKEEAKRLRTRADCLAVLRGLQAGLGVWGVDYEKSLLRAVVEEDRLWQQIVSPGTLDLRGLPSNTAARPGLLLTAAYEVVPFIGREAELAELVAWCGGESPVALRLETGDAGFGKTRFFIELNRTLREEGWRAGFLKQGVSVADLSKAATSLSSCLVIVDYAETRLKLVTELLQQAVQLAPGSRFRLALVSRGKGRWWESLEEEGSQVRHGVLMASQAQALVPLVKETTARRAEVERAAASFAALRSQPVPVVPADLPLKEDGFGSALLLHMAALALVDGRPVTSARDLLAETLKHERRFWRLALEDGGVSGFEQERLLEACELCVAALALVKGVASEAEARSCLASSLGAARTGQVDTVWRVLSRLYPARTAGGVAPLEPDLLGEELVRVVCAREPGFLGALALGANDGQHSSMLDVLVRIARHTPEQGRALLEGLLSARLEELSLMALESAINEGEPMDSVLAGVVEKSENFTVTMQLMNRCDADQVLHKSRHVVGVALAATKSAVEMARVAWYESKAERQADLARLLSNLSSRQARAGQREAALSSAEEATSTFRTLAIELPQVYKPDLALCLNNLSSRQIALGQKEAALTSAEEAVGVYRHLALADREPYEPFLAGSLNTLGTMQSAQDQNEAALTSAAEAVMLYRGLAKARPEDYEPELASSLNGLANRHAILDQEVAALLAAEEVVQIRRRLAQARPEVYEEFLAGSLNNLSLRQSALGYLDAAQSSAEESVAIRRRLAKQRPEVYATDLAKSQGVLGKILGEMGLWAAAAAAFSESLAVMTRSLAARPFVFAAVARALVFKYLAACESAGIEPDDVLLQPIVDILDRLATPDAETTTEPPPA